MPSPNNLWPHQIQGIDSAMTSIERHGGAGLWWGMG